MLNAYHEAFPRGSPCVLSMPITDARDKVGMEDKLLRMSDFLRKSSGMLTSASIMVF